MTVADAYRRLGVLLSELESRGVAVDQVVPDGSATDEPLAVDLRITIPSAPDAPDLRFGEAGATTEGGSTVTRDGGSPPPTTVEATTETDTGASTRGESATDRPDTESQADQSDANPQPDRSDTGSPDRATAAHACDRPDCEAGFESAAALTVHRLAEHDRPDEPLHKHEPALRAAYEAYDSFRAMTEALGVDVTPQTVRRSMIDLDIHDTSAGDTGGDEGRTGEERDDGPTPDEESTAEGTADQQPVTDGSGGTVTETSPADGPSPGGEEGTTDTDADEGAADPAAERLPDDLGVADLRGAVVDGGSLRAAADRLGRSRAETREFLDELDLLWLVHGRVATRPDRAEREEAFEAWLAECRDGEAGE